MKLSARFVFFAAALLTVSKLSAETAEGQGGLVVTFANGAAQDVELRPNVTLYVPEGQSPTPFLSPGAFKAAWTGKVSLEKRAEYSFQAELAGAVKVTINGTPVLEVAEGAQGGPGQSLRLNKGANDILVEYQSPAKGDAFLRLAWKPKVGLAQPLPEAALSHETSGPLGAALQLHRGRELFLEHRCAKCHTEPGATSPVETNYDAPSFEGIGSRRNAVWMDSWLANPHARRARARMPQVFHGTDAAGKTGAVAAYLASLKEAAPNPLAGQAKPDQAEVGAKLFNGLHCVACHIPPGSDEKDAKRMALTHVKEKFATGQLVAFLRKPSEHFTWIRMPNFRLTADEASALAGYLEKSASPAMAADLPADADLVAKGRDLVQTAGCLACHKGPGENKARSAKLKDIPAGNWEKGCLAASVEAAGNAPFFNLPEPDRKALTTFAQTDRLALGRHVATEFAARQSENLNCRQCHGKFEGFPTFEILPAKLKPEWSGKFIAGEVAYKPRTWIESRMPGFAPYAKDMGEGLAMLAGLPPKTPEEPAIDAEASKVGQKIVGANGGLSCVSCHAVGQFGATQVFESAGINFAHTAERIQKDFFHRWLVSPISVDPTTKMPVYFDEEGKSPLADIYEGDGVKTRDAVWQYIRLGSKMPAPE